MSMPDWINDGIQLLIAVVAIGAVIVSLWSNRQQLKASDKNVKEQIAASDKQVAEQINASNIQLQKQLEASDKQLREQIEENRRLATEERQLQSRPILAPEREIIGYAATYYSLQDGKVNESLYTSEGWVDWSWQHPVGIKMRNLGNGPAFNVHALLYGSQDTTQSQFVSWDNGPIAQTSMADITLEHPTTEPRLLLFHGDSVDGKHPLCDKSLESSTNPWRFRAACLTLTYHDLFGKKYVSIFHYTQDHHWLHIATDSIPGDTPLDLKELNLRKMGQNQLLNHSRQ